MNTSTNSPKAGNPNRCRWYAVRREQRKHRLSPEFPGYGYHSTVTETNEMPRNADRIVTDTSHLSLFSIGYN